LEYSLSGYNGYHRLYTDGNDGLWLKNRGTLKHIDMRLEREIPNIDSMFQTMGIHEKISDFFIDPYKNKWFVGEGNRLLLWESKTGVTSVFLNRLPQNNALLDLTVAEGNLYLFYKSGDVRAYNLLSKKEVDLGNPIIDQKYNETLLVVPDGDYIYQVRNGLAGGIVHRLDINGAQWTEVLKTAHPLNTLAIDKSKAIWITS